MYVTERWLGGLLTNFQTVKKQVRRLKDLEAGSEEGGDFQNYTKKEQLMMSRERDKLNKYLSGHQEHDAACRDSSSSSTRRRRRSPSPKRTSSGIPIVAIVDTNADPDLITVPIAGNDDAIRSVELMTKAIADTIVEARREAPKREESEEGEEGQTTYSSDRGTEPADEGEKRRRRRPRRRAKPEAIAARLNVGGQAADAPDAGAGAVEEPAAE